NLVYYNDAAERMIGRSFSELGEIRSEEFGEALRLRDSDGVRIRRRDSPSGIAFFERRATHRSLTATGYDGVERAVEVTAVALFGKGDEMHGVVTVFWQASTHSGSE